MMGHPLPVLETTHSGTPLITHGWNARSISTTKCVVGGFLLADKIPRTKVRSNQFNALGLRTEDAFGSRFLFPSLIAKLGAGLFVCSSDAMSEANK